MSRQADWDLALRIRGLRPRDMSLARLAAYLEAWSALLGEGSAARFAGIRSGSTVLRAKLPGEDVAAAKSRLATSSALRPSDTTKAQDRVVKLLAEDQAEAKVEDREGAVILIFPRQTLVEPQPTVVQDSAIVDGVVVGLAGQDETSHVRLLDANGEIHRVTVRNMVDARRLGHHFRSDPIRAHVHGTWIRTAEGAWEPHALYLDRFEELGQEPASEIFDSLAAVPGNRWKTLENADALLAALRSGE